MPVKKLSAARCKSLPVICKRFRNMMKERSRLNHLPFESEVLTVRFLMAHIETNPKCQRCGVPFAIGGVKNGVQAAASPSIDRIIPSLGYTLKNVAILCWRCNNLKRDADPAELKKVADLMDASLGCIMG